jgi:hypothetical protein
MGIMVPETCWARNKICNKKHLLHLVGILFPHIVHGCQHFCRILFTTVNLISQAPIVCLSLYGIYLIRLKHRHLEKIEVLWRFWTNSGNFGRNCTKRNDRCMCISELAAGLFVAVFWVGTKRCNTVCIVNRVFFVFCCKITFIYYFYQRA